MDGMYKFAVGVLSVTVLLLALAHHRQQDRIEALEATVESAGLEIVVEKSE